MSEPINSSAWTGYPPGTVRFEAPKIKRPPWWRRLWNRFRGRRVDYEVTYSFARGPRPTA